MKQKQFYETPIAEVFAINREDALVMTSGNYSITLGDADSNIELDNDDYNFGDF